MKTHLEAFDGKGLLGSKRVWWPGWASPTPPIGRQIHQQRVADGLQVGLHAVRHNVSQLADQLLKARKALGVWWGRGE